MRDHRKTLHFPTDPTKDALTAEAFSAFVESLDPAPTDARAHASSRSYLDTIATSGREPAWFSLEAEDRRHKVTALIHSAATDLQAELLATHAAQADRETAAAAHRLARRITACSETLAFLRQVNTSELLPLALRCHSRWCPPCAISRSYSRAFRVLAALQPIAARGALTHAVFTCPNVPLEKLRVACRGLSHALRDLLRPPDSHRRRRRDNFRIAGTLHNLEVTHNRTDDSYHPHRHALIEAPYLDQDRISWEWSICLVRAGFPSRDSLVYLSRIRPNERHRTHADDDHPSSALTDAVFEVSKYLSKPADAYDGDGFPTPALPEIIRQMRGLRSSDATGTIKAAIAAQAAKKEPGLWLWLGSLRAIMKGTPAASTSEALRAVAGNAIARTIFARKYDLSAFAPRRKPTTGDAADEQQLTDQDERDLKEQIDLLPSGKNPMPARHRPARSRLQPPVRR